MTPERLMTDPTREPSEQEVEAAARALGASAVAQEPKWTVEGWLLVDADSNAAADLRSLARAALTAAAQVRERAPADEICGMERERCAKIADSRANEISAGFGWGAWTEQEYELMRGVATNIANDIRGIQRKPSEPALMPIYGATEPDEGPDVLGMRKGEE